MASIVSTTCFCLVIQIFAQIFDRQLMCDYWVLGTGESLLTVFSPKSWIYCNVKTLCLLCCPLAAFAVSPMQEFLASVLLFSRCSAMLPCPLVGKQKTFLPPFTHPSPITSQYRRSQNSSLIFFFCSSLLWSLTSFYLTWWTLTLVTPRPWVTSNSGHSPAHLQTPVLPYRLDTHSSKSQISSSWYLTILPFVFNVSLQTSSDFCLLLTWIS